ncbi:hypothetical protein Hanom_Chr04g00297881 [Helianthus anomalus]
MLTKTLFAVIVWMDDVSQKAYKEAKRAKRWDPDRECYVDPKGNVCTDPKSIDFEALVKSIPSEEGQIKIDAAKRAEKERLRKERYEEFLKSKKSKNLDEGIIDVKAEMTVENLTKMVDQIMMAKALEVDSKSALESESSGKVSSNGSNVEPGKAEKAKSESDCMNCMKEGKEFFKQKKKLVNAQLDEIANLKLQYQEARIENERINLKLNNYTSASFVLQYIVRKPIGKNKDGEDVYSDGTEVGYHKVPPPMSNNFTKKQSGLDKELDLSEKSEADKLPDNIDVSFNSQSDEDSIESEVVKEVVEKVLKSDSDSINEDDDCFFKQLHPQT